MHKKNIYYYFELVKNSIAYIHFRYGISPKTNAYIAMFHNVIDCEENELLDNYSCTLESFKKYIKHESTIRSFVSLDDFINNGVNSKCCVLTFDDGFSNVYKTAFPYLLSKRIPFLVYLSTSLINTDGYLSTNQIKEMCDSGLCTIGMHGHNHVQFRYQSDDYLINDFHRCYEIIKTLSCCDHFHYAFPYGSLFSCSSSNIKTIKQLGVKSIALTTPRTIKKRINIFALPRINIPRIISNFKEQ